MGGGWLRVVLRRSRRWSTRWARSLRLRLRLRPSRLRLRRVASEYASAIPAQNAPEQVAQVGGAAQAPVAESAAAAPGGGVAAVDQIPTSSAASTDPNFASPTAHAAFEAAKKELGVPYQWGGSSPQTGFDCSGLMQWAYHRAGVNLPRVAADQFNVGTPVRLNDLREGDLVFFRIGGAEVDHVGMYVGNHEFLEAPATGQDVQYANLNDPYWSSQFAGARRIVPLEVPTPGAAAGTAAGAPPGGSGTAAGSPAGALNEAPTVPASQSSAPVIASGADASGGSQAGLGSGGAISEPTGSAAGVASSAVEPGAVGDTTPAAAPGTAAFKAVPAPEAGSPSHTVQFLRAVQPSPAPSPAVEPNVVQPGSGQPSVEGVSIAGPSESAPTGPGGIVESAAGQSSGAGAGPQVVLPAAAHRLLTSDQQLFAARLAAKTGLNPSVVSAWLLAEESSGAAVARQAASNNDWLNIGWTGSGNFGTSDAIWSDPIKAADATAGWLQGQNTIPGYGSASAGVQEILKTTGESAAAQIAALQHSGWSGSGYPDLPAIYTEVAD